MTALDLATAHRVAATVLAAARQRAMRPLAVAVLDERGVLRAFLGEDGIAPTRADVAIAKAASVITMGMGARALARRARDKPDFVASVGQFTRLPFLVMLGGVLLRDNAGTLIGAVGVTGDSSENDELAAELGIREAGFTPDSGHS